MKYLLILIALCPGCRWSIGNPAEGQLPQRTGAPAGNYITLPIDSFRHYPLLTDGKSFVRMLKAEKNRLWHFNSRNLLELINLADTAAARPVALPERFANLVYSERDVVAEDGPDGGLWICNYSRGLLRYSARDGVFRPSPLGSCGSLYVLDNYVAVADIQHGLIVLNKAMEILDTITDFPLHQIHDVRETGRFGLVINGCRYDPQDGKLEKITRIGEVELPDGFSDLLEKDSFVVYSPGQVANIVHLIVNGRRHYPEHFLASPRNRIIEGHTFWACFADKIARWDLKTQSKQSIRMALPMPFPWLHQNDTTRFWIASASGLFSFDKNSGAVHKYPLAEGTKLRQFFADEGHLYFLFDGRFSIYNKQYLDAHRTRFNMQWYAQEKERYALAMDSLGLRQTQSFPLYLEKSRWLEEQFGAFLAIHPMPDHLGLAYNIWEYEPFRAGFFEALAARRVRPDILEKNYSPLLRRLANDGKIKAVLFLDSLYRDGEIGIGNDGPDYRMYHYGIKELQNLQQARDSLRAAAESEEQYLFQEALLFRSICRIGWMGESYCDQSLCLSRLEAFAQRYPASPLRDDAGFYIADIKSRDWENGMIESADGYTRFLEAFPASNKKPDAMMALLEYYCDRELKREGLEMAERIKREFPEVAEGPEYGNFLRVLNTIRQ
ncbi:MAG: hypothetical protein KDD19_23065 [Phaeodactylibacter sp.]|nr:hypothetical protein [Phaeodactylibacter sp.]